LNGCYTKIQRALGIGKGCESDPNTMNLNIVKFNQETTLVALIRTIIIYALPFRFVENEELKKFVCKKLQTLCYFLIRLIVKIATFNKKK